MNDNNSFLDLMTALCGFVLAMLIALMIWQSLVYRRLYLNYGQVDFERGHSFPYSLTSRVGSRAILLRAWEDPWDDEEEVEDTEEMQPW